MDTLVEILTRKYPKTILLEDESRVTFRPLHKDDEKPLAEFFKKLPLKDRACLKEDVADPQVIESWIYNLDYDSVLPIIATDNGTIVGDATLHFNPIGWTRHQGEIRLTTDTHFRGKGLGTMLAKDIIDIAKELGLELLSIEMAPGLYEAFSLFEKLGFTKAAVLKGFIIDLDGNETDLILMTMRLNGS
ncbi:MAG TPA: GNAT family N-acetyltransferase [Thermodesulfovibrionales bacterium]|nr:GNAT family N-acetyltransferase [Thermodesulfovibrionales bacterium]